MPRRGVPVRLRPAGDRCDTAFECMLKKRGKRPTFGIESVDPLQHVQHQFLLDIAKILHRIQLRLVATPCFDADGQLHLVVVDNTATRLFDVLVCQNRILRLEDRRSDAKGWRKPRRDQHRFAGKSTGQPNRTQVESFSWKSGNSPRESLAQTVSRRQIFRFPRTFLRTAGSTSNRL